MKKRALIELTPLLDVILLLIFAFMINMQGQSDAMNEEYSELEEMYNESVEYAESLEQKNEALENQTEVLESELESLEEELKALTSSLENEQTANVYEKETIEAVIAALSDIAGDESSELNALLEENSEAMTALSEVLDADDSILELYKYEYVMNKFYFIDIELIGEENYVYINGEKSNIAISADDNTDSDTREEKTLKIYDELKEMIDSRSGGDEMVMVTLIVRDPEVYQYAFEITWDALRELELSANGYRLYKTSYTYIN